MNPLARVLAAWSWDPTVIAGCAGLVVAYVWALRAVSIPIQTRRGVGTASDCGRRGETASDCGRMAGTATAVGRAVKQRSDWAAMSLRASSTAVPVSSIRPQSEAAPPPRSEAAPLYRPLSFLAAVAILFLALQSPLDTLADTYLFSAHMVQHLLLIVVVPPLLLLGLPPSVIRALLEWAPAAVFERALGRPPVAWGVGVLTVWLWHLPRLYDAAVASEEVHVVQHLTFLVAATIFWWPVVAPEPYRLATWPAIGYLALGGFANTVLAIVITFAPAGLYPIYERPVDRLGILPLLRDRWGLTPGADQQLGGVLMWVPGGWAYLLAAILTLARWYGEVDEPPRRAAGAREVAT